MIMQERSFTTASSGAWTLPDDEADKTNSGDENADLQDKRIDYLYQSIQDTQNTIRFLDAKASAVLVVHGILIAATVSAAQRLVPLLRESLIGDLLFWTYFLVLIFQALSIYFVILCVRGRSNPKEAVDQSGLTPKQTFYVHNPGWKDKTWEVMRGTNSCWKTDSRAQLAKINGLDNVGIVNELVFEQLKLSFIRARKHSKITIAFRWLSRALLLLFAWVLIVSVFLYGLSGFLPG